MVKCGNHYDKTASFENQILNTPKKRNTFEVVVGDIIDTTNISNCIYISIFF